MGKNWRKLTLLAAVIIFIFLLWNNRQELISVRNILHQATWSYIFAAFFFQFLFFVFQAVMYHQILSLSIPVAFRETLLLTIVSSAINKIVPSGGISGLLAFVSQARQKGVKSEISLAANVWFYLLDYLSFLIVVWWGTAYYATSIGLNRTQKWAVSTFSLIIVASALVIMIVIKNFGSFRRLLGKVRIARPQFIKRLLNLAINKTTELEVIEEKWRPNFKGRLLTGFISGLAMQMADITILFLCFKTIGFPVSVGAVVAGFGLASVLALISTVPQGIGIYETSMTWIFQQMGIPFGIALTVALLYRAITFWFPIIPGLLGMLKRRL